MVGTYASVGLIAVGAVLMALTGRGPLDGAPAFQPERLPDDLRSLQPAGFLWLGIVVVLATPLARVVTALVGYLRVGEREMALVASLILIVITLGVVAGTMGG
jgi:uncharacterized membrane protein